MMRLFLRRILLVCVCFKCVFILQYWFCSAQTMPKKKKEKKKHSKEDRSKQHNKADYPWCSGLSMGWGSLALKFRRQWYQTFKSLHCVCNSVSPASFLCLPVPAAWTCRATTTHATPLDSSGSMPSGQNLFILRSVSLESPLVTLILSMNLLSWDFMSPLLYALSFVKLSVESPVKYFINLFSFCLLLLLTGWGNTIVCRDSPAQRSNRCRPMNRPLNAVSEAVVGLDSVGPSVSFCLHIVFY